MTPVSVALPVECENKPLVQLCILTSNAVGNDAMVGVDDINVTGTGGGSTTLSGSGLANPNPVAAGSSALLTVSVTPASDPASTGITVNGNLSQISGSATQQFFDNGTNGDTTAGDNTFSFLAAIPPGALGASFNLPMSIADAQTRTANTSISLTIVAPIDPTLHLAMGNPSNATVDVNQPTNYLLAKNQYVISYHRDRGIPNWVSWHLDTSWIGTTPRQDDFRPDPSLPAGWFQVQDNTYSGSGFDRGHHCPSGDRTASVPDNSATFFMTNMMPQAPDNNQGPWEELESYCRTLVQQGNELYIIAGGAGQGGAGSNGAATTIGAGHVVVPSVTWKVIVVLPNGNDDSFRVNRTTRTIAVIMPNTQGIRNNPWRDYRTSIHQVEKLTGYNFLSNVRRQIQYIVEKRVDTL